MTTQPDAVDRGCALHARAQELRDAGNPTKARELCNRALKVLESALGPRHPDVANVLLEIAGTYMDRGEAPMAMGPCERALAILVRVRSDVDGERLRYTALSMLGSIYIAVYRFPENVTRCGVS